MALQTRILNGNIHVSGDGDESSVIICETVTEKIGLWGVTPVVQPASASQADQGVMTTVGANTGTAGAGLTSITNTDTTDQSANIMDDLLALQEDIAAQDVLLTEIRTALVNVGIIKGTS